MWKKVLLLTFIGVMVVGLGFALKIKQMAERYNPTNAVQEPLAKKIQANIYRMIHRSSVYDFLRKSYYTFGIPNKGVIHIGARHGEELGYYIDQDIKDVLWIEADPSAEEGLRKAVEKHPGSKIAMFAATDNNGRTTLFRTSNAGHSSSILKLKNHSLHYPDIVEMAAMDVEQRRLDDYLSEQSKNDYNVIVIDVQGAELVALSGATKTLENVDSIIAEVNYDELYEGCVQIAELDKFLAEHGFTRVDLISTAYYTGDALYIKNKFFKLASVS